MVYGSLDPGHRLLRIGGGTDPGNILPGSEENIGKIKGKAWRLHLVVRHSEESVWYEACARPNRTMCDFGGQEIPWTP